ncbi:MAG: hypothetical protein Q7S12_04150, partial [bacterium]|nr:hypothetical protein [bacterium]
MFGLFGKQAKKLRILAVDVGTVSISAALAEKTLPSGKYEIKKVLRYFFQLIDISSKGKDRNEQIMKMFLGGFNKLFADTFKLEPGVDEILISFSDPFFLEKKIARSVSRKHPQNPITHEEIAKLLKEMETEANEGSMDLSLAGKEMISLRVNGYSVDNAAGYKGSTLEASGLFTLISKFLKEYVENAKEKFFPRSKINYYSDIRVLWQVLKSTENLFESAVVIDIGGEMTSLFFVGAGSGAGNKTFLSDAIEHGKSFAFGVRTLERRLAAFLNTDFLEAEAVFKKYTAQTLDEAMRVKVSKILDSAMEDWWSSLKVSLVDFKGKNILITGGGADCEVFSDAVKLNFKKYYDLDASVHILQAEAFKDYFLSPDMLKGGSDVVLASLML